MFFAFRFIQTREAIQGMIDALIMTGFV